MPSSSLGREFKPNLWSSAALSSDVELVRHVHQEYLEAGAEVLSSCTYQLSLEACDSKQHANTLMERAIGALEKIAGDGKQHTSVLSLGPCAVIHPSGAEVKPHLSIFTIFSHKEVFRDIPTPLLGHQ